MRRGSFHLILIWCLSVMLCGCGGKPETGEAVPTAVVPVKIAAVRRGDMPLNLVALGQTEAFEKEIVASPVAGIVTSLPISEGTSVKSGEVLTIIQTKESQATAAGAEALRAMATTPQLQAEADRAVQLARNQDQTVKLTAHRNGIVAGRHIVVGSQVAEGTELFAIIDPASVEFVALVPIGGLRSISVGQNAIVVMSSLDSLLFHAVVAAVSPEAESQTQTVRVRLRFVDVGPGERPLLRDGLSGTAQIETGRHSDVLLIPRAALLRNDETDDNRVVTITADSLAKTLPVTVGLISDSLAEVSAPELHEGMSVVIEGHYALADSTRVTVVPQTSP
jgi:multidrug efflux pump subunit AcrA (membrane-fusion protein)